jgi:hypothetical protein
MGHFGAGCHRAGAAAIGAALAAGLAQAQPFTMKLSAPTVGQIPRTVEGVALGTIESTMPATGFLIGLDPRFAVFDAAVGDAAVTEFFFRTTVQAFAEGPGVSAARARCRAGRAGRWR